MLSVSVFSPARAQDSVTVHGGVEYLDWRKLPQTVVEGIVGASPGGWIIIDTGTSHPIFRAGQEFSYRPPVGKHFVNFKPCLNYEGFRVRVTYTAATGNGYDGDFRILEVLAQSLLEKERPGAKTVHAQAGAQVGATFKAVGECDRLC